MVKLTKKFGDLTAVDGVTFRVERGEIFGFLGDNGAEEQVPWIRKGGDIVVHK